MLPHSGYTIEKQQGQGPGLGLAWQPSFLFGLQTTYIYWWLAGPLSETRPCVCTTEPSAGARKKEYSLKRNLKCYRKNIPITRREILSQKESSCHKKNCLQHKKKLVQLSIINIQRYEMKMTYNGRQPPKEDDLKIWKVEYFSNR